MRQLLEAGVHFGHQTRRWNPKMRPFIFAERNGIHIIDLAQTVQRLDVALAAVTETVARGEQVLFVGTKKQAQEPIVAEATRANMPYVQKRWLGGMLTNFTTIKKRIGLLEQLEARQWAGDFERMTKKEAAKLTEEMTKLQGTVGGMRKMKRLPGLVFIIDPHRERIAVTEANKLEIPVVGTAIRTSTPTSSTTSSLPTTTPSGASGCCAPSSPRPPSRAPASARPARSSPRSSRCRCPRPARKRRSRVPATSSSRPWPVAPR
jgi:small subunit ribosomal protein S2